MPSSPAPPAEALDALSFDALMTRLEALTEQLESGEGSLEDALAAYERGVALARTCMDRLQQADLRIQELRLEG